MWKTILALLVTLVVIPFIAFRYDDPLSTSQSAILIILATVYLPVALLCFVISMITGNHSQVDKLWSLIPIAYV